MLESINSGMYLRQSTFTIGLIYDKDIYKKRHKYKEDIYIKEQTYRKTYIQREHIYGETYTEGYIYKRTYTVVYTDDGTYTRRGNIYCRIYKPRR